MRNSTKRKREFRIHERLSSGQHFNMYFKKYNSDRRKGEPLVHGVWKVGLCVSETRREANDWWNSSTGSRLERQSTGKAGLEALRRAAEYLVDFSRLLGFHSELQVNWSDDKRRSAYRRLLRYGFIECEDCYMIRNPEYWVFKTKEDEGNETPADKEM